VKQTVVPNGTGRGSSDIICVIYSILLFPVLLSSFILVFFMVALCNRADHYIFILFLLSFFFLFFSLPNLSGRRLDVYHTLARGVALVRI